MAPYNKRDFVSHGVLDEVYSGMGGMEISSIKLCRLLAGMFQWDAARSYRVPGTVYSEKRIAVFELIKAEIIDH